MALRFVLLVSVLLASTLANADVTCGAIKLRRPHSSVGVNVVLSQQGSLDVTKDWRPLFDGDSQGLKFTEIKSGKAVILDEHDFTEMGQTYLVRQIAVEFNLAADDNIGLVWDEQTSGYLPTKTLNVYVVCTESNPK